MHYALKKREARRSTGRNREPLISLELELIKGTQGIFIRVLPDPVGATTSTFSPEWIAGHACRWASVGRLNACLNHALVGSENKFKHSHIRSIIASP